MAPPPQAPVIEADVPPEVTIVDAEPEPEPPVVEAAPAPMPEPEPPAPQPPAPPAPNVPPTTAPALPRPPLSELLGTWKSAIVERLPPGKTRLIAGGSIALVGIVSILLLTSGGDEASQPDAVVAAGSTPSVETAPPRPEAPKPKPVPLPKPEPSEAELFYRANVAFESGDFEQSKQELLMLLELKPNLAAARELMSRVERELAPQPEPPKPKPRPRRAARKPAPKPEPTPEPDPEPAPPTPSELFAGAQAALNRGELEDAQAKLNDLKTMNPRYPGAQQLESELSDRFWERKLPLVFSARHDHALGGCNGVLTLTSRGYGYRSDDHEWFWSFGEIGKTDRRGARSLRLETTRGKSYKFELRDALSNDDWSRYQGLRSR